MLVAHVGDVHAHAVLDPGDVVQVAAVLRDQRVDERHVRAGVDELAREVRADEAEAAGDQHALLRERRRELRQGHRGYILQQCRELSHAPSVSVVA